MEEATSSIEVMNSELSELTPQCNEGHDDVKQSQQRIEATQKDYQEQKEACKNQELELEKIKAPVDKLKKESQEEFGKVVSSILKRIIHMSVMSGTEGDDYLFLILMQCAAKMQQKTTTKKKKKERKEKKKTSNLIRFYLFFNISY